MPFSLIRYCIEDEEGDHDADMGYLPFDTSVWELALWGSPHTYSLTLTLACTHVLPVTAGKCEVSHI